MLYLVKDFFLFSGIRETIKINDVPYFKMLDNEVGYIKLSSFTQTASKEFIAAFNELKDLSDTDLIIKRMEKYSEMGVYKE